MPVQSKYSRMVFILLAMALFVLLACKGYIFYEDGEDPFFTMLYRGEFTGGPQNIPNSFGGWLGLTYIIIWLFQWQNRFDWYAAFMVLAYCLLIFQISQILPTLYSHVKKISSKWVMLLIVISSAILFSEHFFFLQLTRISLLLSGISVFRMLQSAADKENASFFKVRANIFNILCFTYAALIRPEPAALSLVIWMPVAGLGVLTGVPLKKYLVLVVPAIIIIGISQILNTPFNQTDRDYLEFRKYQFSLFDFQQPESSLNIRDAKDSITFAVCRKPFFADSKQINTAFFNRIGVLPLDKTVSSIPYYFKNLSSAPAKIKLGWQKLMAWNPGLAFLYLFYLMAGIAFIYNVAPKSLPWYLLSQLFPILLCLAITAFMKMENRVLMPMMWCFIIENLIWCGTLVPEVRGAGRNTQLVLLICALFIIPPFVLDASKTYVRWETKKAESAAMKNLVAEINAMPEKIIVVNGNTLAKLYWKPFDVTQRFTGKRPVVIENFMLYWLPGYRPYMQTVCGGSSIVDIINFLELNKKDVLMFGQPEKMEILKNYLRIIYDIPFNYEVSEINNMSSNNEAKRNPKKNTLYRII